MEAEAGRWIRFGETWGGGECEYVPSDGFPDLFEFARTELGKEIRELSDTEYQRLKKDWRKIPEVWAWWAEQQRVNLEYNARCARSFCGQNLNLPGTAIVVRGRVLVIGHVNSAGMDGGCCPSEGVASGDIVEYYMAPNLPEAP